ncbi:hypothetical protein TNCV_1830131 [Trichonephila clavipes]|nr:hypothetical protein TNCV_1830131 [Trichonephila clavipes]
MIPLLFAFVHCSSAVMGSHRKPSLSTPELEGTTPRPLSRSGEHGHPASPDHILRCIGLSNGDLSDPLTIIDFFCGQQPSGADLTNVRSFQDYKQQQLHMYERFDV